MVTPLGSGVDHNWSEIIAGKSGITKIENFDVSDISCQIAGQVPGAGQPGGLNLDDWIEPREQRKQDRFIQLGLAAACQAVEDSGWKPDDREAQNRTGVMIGSGIGGLESIVVTDQLMHEKGPRRISPFFIPSALINLISGMYRSATDFVAQTMLL
jgi:3-oxoacyl-[acyl-carrier-protein] synthase II